MARAMRQGHALRRIPRPREIMALVIPLLAFAIRRATRAAISMEARGLHPGCRRSQLPQPGMTPVDLVASACSLLVLFGVLHLI